MKEKAKEKEEETGDREKKIKRRRNKQTNKQTKEPKNTKISPCPIQQDHIMTTVSDATKSE